MSRQRQLVRSKRARLLLVALVVVLATVFAALAYFTAPGSGSGTAAVGNLNPPTAVTVGAPGVDTAPVSWTASSTGGGAVSPQGYFVTRTNTLTDATSSACGTSSSSLTTALSCIDGDGTPPSNTPVPAGNYTYTVTAAFHSWSAQSAPSGTVTVPTCVAGNEIACENQKSGNPESEWQISGAGDSSIQGFATEMSVDQGGTVNFKIDTGSTNYRIDIYRLGWYQGNGARLVDTIQPSVSLPQTQPACLGLGGTLPDNLVDCGNWGISASWLVPSDAVSGIYIARATREDVGGDLASHIAFVVRDDDGNSNLLVQTSDTTWQAYNQYGGYSLYGPGHAHKVSYNRPFTTRGVPTEDWLFNAEYPMVRWLERNGYDVSYFSEIDSDRRGAEILEHEAFFSVGHDEYWSAGQRANVEAARDAGVNLAFFSGNEIYWKTRWEPSTADGGSTDYRTLVSYKEGDAQGSEHWDCAGNFNCDPDPDTWTGLWRQNQTGHDGGRPENALSGQISWGDDTTAIQVPASATGLRFWRNTGMSGATTLAAATLGYEFDWEQDAFASSYPPGRITLSDTTAGGKNHRMSLYRAPSGALVFGAGTVQWSWGLDGTHDRGSSTPDPRMQQATVNLLSDMGAQPETLQSGLTAGGALDTTAPTASITDPTGGATVPGGNVTISGTAADPGGLVVAVEVSTDGGLTWGRATGTTSWAYTFSASNGPVTAQARAVDDAANIGTATSVSFTAAAQTCPCTIFTPSTTGVQENDTNSVELGVKFRSDVAGFITGIRFYKTTGNTGTHTGRLWTTGGVNLGTVTFAGESATGWQEASFSEPIAVEANTTYVASYHTTSGNYAIGTSFAAAGVDNEPLHALQGGGVDGPNGIYRYGGGDVYPTDTFGSSNYLVDVAFVNDVGPDTTAPTIVARSPSPGASAVAVGSNVTATFSEPMAAASVSAATVELRDPSSAVVSATVSYSAATRTAIIDPAAPLDDSTTYTATVKGGAGGVTDAADPPNPLVADVTWSFTTAEPPPPPPDEGPGGPILVVSSAANPFSRFYVEILRNEGLNAFNAVDITSVNAGMLGDYDVVILGEVSIDTSQAAMFEAWVTAGGNLIAMRPDPDLADLIGLTDAGTDLSDAYLLFDTSGGKPGTGLVGQTIQFHGTADRYVTNAGTDALATLYSDASTATANPALTVRSVGSNGGQAAAFTYDLAKSVVYTRQGNPAWAGTERDGQQPPIIRSDDMFFPDWVDFSKIQIPQADEQQRLLANLIEHVNRDQMPLPRFWYFPRGEKAVVVMTGDDHASSGGTVGQFDWDVSVSPPDCNVADWECVRGTSYLYPNTPITDSAAAAYEAQGFELGIHVNTNCANWTPATLAGFYGSQLASFASSFPSVPAPSTHRTHCITWSDWATQPHVELANGIRLDTNYYYWPDAWVANRPGYFTGSGMPMRFADLDGSLIDVYQAATQMTDESGITYSTHINTLLDNAIGGPGYYGVVTTNMHTDNGNHPGQQAVVNAALARDVPVVSARQMLNWLDGRNGSSFEDLTWNADTLSFSIARAVGSNGLQAMLPTQGATGSLGSLTRGGNPVTYSTQTIKGIEYAVFDAAAGSYAATFAVDSTGPTISSVLAVPGAGGTATITWTTNEPATSRVDYGTDANSFSSLVSDDTLKTSHSVDLTGLAPETTYYFRVTSADAVPNTTTSPNPPAAPATFSTPTAVATDTTVADFGAGTTGGSTYVSETANGEVILAPAVGAEFSGSGLPAGWESGPWTGGTALVGGGTVTVDGAWARTSATFAPGRALEFVATFSGAQFQNAGLGQTLESGSESWAMFGMDATANLLRVRINNAGATSQFDLGATYLNAPHRYRIEWDAAQIRFLVDGTLVHTANVTIGANLRPIASDFNTGGGALGVDWMRISPYASSGTFLSRIQDAGSPAAWGTLSYVADVPSGTTLALSLRRGDTPTPDGSWSLFSPIANGQVIGGSSRYLQYRVEATSSTGDVTPTLSSVMLPYTGSADTDPPGISGRMPSPDAADVAVGTNVTVTFDEPMNPATISTSSVTLRAQGAGSDVPATVTYAGVIATLDPLADLAATQYTVTVAASVADAAGNQLGAPDTWTFTTSVPVSYLVDTTVADFGAGTTGASSYVSETGNGEVILAPTVGAEFSGSSLPSGWITNPWVGGGGAVVAGGSVTVDQAAIWTDTFYAPGRSLEFVANFSDPNQHVGFANDFNNGHWAIFSSGASGDQLYARSNVPGGVDTPLGAGYLDLPHRFRIEWTATSARYLVDGVQVAFHTGLAFSGNLRPAASDFNPSGSLAIDWMRMSPYPAGGTFISRVHDAGVAVGWRALDGTATAPVGTGVAFEVRTGDTPTPDGTWSGFAAVVNGADITGTSRYIQYRVTLTTADTGVTPSLDQVALGYVASP